MGNFSNSGRVGRGSGLRALALAPMVLACLWASDAGATGDIRRPLPKPELNDTLRLVVSLEAQQINVYRGTSLIETSRISSGKRGHSTPAGIYSILQKRKWHRSNIYSNAPMPYMQRLTWSGIALHEGKVPNRPASHGCIRLPKGFAKRLFGQTEVGADVIVTAGQSSLVPIAHEALFQPIQPSATELAMNDPERMMEPLVLLASAQMARVPEDDAERSKSPLRILVTRRTLHERLRDAQSLLAELGYDPGEIDGFLGPDTGRAIQAFQRASDKRPTGMFTDALVADLYAAAGREEPNAHLYVRQDYVDLFDAPVSLKDAEAPLGTFMFSSGDFEEDETNIAWTAVQVDGGTPGEAAAVLDRLIIPNDVRERISDLLTPRSSLIVTDAGRGRETGKGTDFIVQP